MERAVLMLKRDYAACLKTLRVGVCVAATLLAATAAPAANEDGQYAVRGIGSTSCGAFVDIIEEDRLPVSYVAWMSGYLSGLNRLEAETFDVSYITQNESMMIMVGRLCSENREIILETAIARLVSFMSENRVKTETEFLRLKVGEQQVMIRQSVYDRFVEILVEKGFLDTPKGFSEQVRDAVVEFQEARGLTQTGLPDENTLVSAFSPAR